MFFDVNRAGQYEYVRILETCYEDGKQKKRVVATLALFLERSVEHPLEDKGICLTPTEAFAAMRSLGVRGP